MIGLDASGLREHIKRFAQTIPAHLKGFVQRIPYIVQAYVGSEMTDLGTGVVFNPGQQLGIRTGSVLRSLIPNQPHNIFKATVTADGAFMEIGTTHPGANANETGQPAFIASKGKMENWFWAQYIRTKKRDYLIIALAIRKRGGVRRKARPSMKPGIQRMLAEGLPKMQEEMAMMIINDWQRTFNG